MNFKRGYSFDDVLIEPSYSDLPSRESVSLRTEIGGIKIRLPIISSPMDTVTEVDMAFYMHEQGGMGVIHRYMSVYEQAKQVKWAKANFCNVGAAVGANGDAHDRASELEQAGADFLVMDVAHGENKNCLTSLDKMANRHSIPISSGNIATREAAARSIDAGAKILRVGIGGGSACTTRVVAGVGVPQLSAVLECARVAQAHPGKRISIISDGGVRNSADAVKALAAGADAVMIGGFLAAFPMAAGEQQNVPVPGPPLIPVIGDGSQHPPPNFIRKKFFRGMASRDALLPRKQGEKIVEEGDVFEIEIDYDYERKFDKLRDGIALGMSYVGAKNIAELRDVTFVEVSPLAFRENAAHYGG